jgi:hypothetical protein
MTRLAFKYNDGGREKAGFKGTTGDCVARAVAIATELDYKQAYNLINEIAKNEKTGKRKRGKSNARTGVYKYTTKKIMEKLGWKWIPTMFIGSGCKVHLRRGEVPSGKIIVSLSKHISVVINGVINDIYNPDRFGNRCIYGYWIKN